MGFVSLGRVKDAAMSHLGSGSVLPIAIDFGVSALKVLQLCGGDPPSLVAAAAVPTPDEIAGDPAKRFPFQFQALGRIIRGVSFKGKRAVCSIPAAQMFCKSMQFPKTDGTDLGQLVEAAVSQALGCPQNALIYRHVPVVGASSGGGSGGKTEVICLAAARDMVARIMQAVRDSKLELVGIQPEYLASLAAFDRINQRVEDQHVATMYLDLAAGSTKVSIAHGKSLVFAKTVQMGGRDLDHVVARALECDLATARARRLAASVSPAPAPVHQRVPAPVAATGDSGAPVAVGEELRHHPPAPTPGLTPDLAAQPAAPVAPAEFDLQEPLEVITDEVAMCLRYYESIFPERKVQRAIFTGGEARHRGLCQHIARRLRLPAQVADPAARMARTGKEPCKGVDFGSPQPGWTIAFGLSMCPTDL